MDRYCILDIGEQRIALPLEHIRETIPFPDYVPMPLSPEHVLGLFGLRGEVFSLLDLRPLLGVTDTSHVPSKSAPACAVLQRGGVRFALPIWKVATAELDTNSFTAHPRCHLFPALDALCEDSSGKFDVVQFDRLESSLKRSLGFDRLAPTH